MKIDDSKNTETWELGMLVNTMRDKNEGTDRGREKGRHLRPRLVQKVAEGISSYEWSWKVTSDDDQKTQNQSNPT